ncbi:unnamed protein product [Phytophthora fragariaefolia]|uniref:Unnamed protein product n=1 Tax=Phytophthora fragariaefolia TaxID=1490495 RepID=A0A9W6YEE1_9STRA|nr:unnamed protein product [Phytophthora fragariaefolia]
MSMPTTHAAGTPAASAAANIVVPFSATTERSLASTSVVTSTVTTPSSLGSTSVATPTVTTPSSPKRTMSLGDYKKARGNVVLARDELEALFDVSCDADIEGVEEEDEGTSPSTRVDPSVGSRRPREDDSDASSPKRSRSGSDRPLADAGPLSSPRSGGDSTSSNTVVSRTGAVRDPWMPTPSEIQSRFCSTSPPCQYALYSCSGIIDDEVNFDPATDQRRNYYIGLFHDLRWYGNKKTFRRSRVPEWQALCQSWGAFVENLNKNTAGYRKRVRLTRERYERSSKRPKIDRLHWCAVEAGILCAVTMGIASKRDMNGYTGDRVPKEPKALCTNLIAQMASSDAGGRSTLPRAVGDYSSLSSFTPFGGFGGVGLRTPSPFPERPASGRSAAPMYRGSKEILSNEYENDPDLASGSDDQQFTGQTSVLPTVRLAVGVGATGRRRGSGPPDSVIVWRMLNASRRLRLPR